MNYLLSVQASFLARLAAVIRAVACSAALCSALAAGQALAQASPVAEYRFDDAAWCSPVSALDSVGGHHGALSAGVFRQDSPAAGSKPSNGAAAGFSGGSIDINGLPLNLLAGGMNSVSFWMYWDGTSSGMPIGFGLHDLWFNGGSFGFNTFASDIFGISSAGLAGGWHHVAAVFTNGNVAANQLWIDGVAQALTQRAGTPNNANATVSQRLRISGVWNRSGYLFGGALDVVRVYSGALSQAQVDADRALSSPAVACTPPPPVLLDEYRFDDLAWCTPSLALDSVGGHHGVPSSGVRWKNSPALASKPVNGGAAGFSGGSIDITGLPLDLRAGGVNSISFWMYWDGVSSGMPIGFGSHDLWFNGGFFGFNTFNSDVFGIPSAGLAGGWHHVAAVFTNGNVALDKLWIDGAPQVLTQLAATPNNANAVASDRLRLSGVWNHTGYQFGGQLDVVRVYSGAVTQSEVNTDRALSSAAVVCPVPPPVLVAHYRLDDRWELTQSAVNSVSGGAAGTFSANFASKVAAPAAAPNKPNTCSGASFATTSGPLQATSASLELGAGGKNSVSFWMYWNGGDSQMPFGFRLYDLWLQGGSFGFNSAASDIYGISSAGLANGWHHVAAVFTNGDLLDNKLWIDGVPQLLTQRQSTPNNSVAHADNAFQWSGWANSGGFRFSGKLDELKVYRGELTDVLVQGDYTDICVVADWQMDETAWNGSASEVKDSGGGQYHGQARVAAGATPVPTTQASSPARTSGGESTCAYGEFDKLTAPARTYSYVELPNFPALPSSFTFAAWIRSSNASAQHQRILVRDDADNGWGLSLADGSGQPELRFFNRSIANSGPVTGQGRNPGCGVFCLDTDPVITSNAWYYIAAAIDTAGKAVTLYVFDAGGSLKAKTSAAFSGTWADGSGLVTIGGESAASSEGRQSAWHFLGHIDELRIFSGVLAETEIRTMSARTRSCSKADPGVPAAFNCVETGAGAANGHLFTRLTGSGFGFDVVALKAGGQVETAFASEADKTLSVELVDGAGSLACASRDALSPAISQSLTFTQANQAAEQGRKTVAGVVVDKAYANLRCRVTDASQTPAVVACSSDSFAVRPRALAVSSSASADGAGNSPTATPAIKAGTGFSLSAASGVAGYDAIPRLDTRGLMAHGSALQVGTLSGAFGNADRLTGSATGSFNYSEVGYFNIPSYGVYDDSFTAVDAAAGDCSADFANTAVGGRFGCKFGNAATTSFFGRFIPDRFALDPPLFEPGCSAGSFTYMSQPLALSATVNALNASVAVTQNYRGAFARGVVSVQLENANSGTPIASSRLSGVGTPAWSAGRYPFVAGAFARAAAVDGPYDALDIGLAVVDETALPASARPYLLVRDMDAANSSCTVDLTGLSTAASVCSATRIVTATKMRFGRMRLGNAYGSELLDLSIPVQAQYWNGTAFVQNGADSCSTVGAGSVVLTNYQGGLSAASMGLAHVSTTPIVAGAGSIKLAKPTPATRGSVDLVLNLGSLGLPSNCPGWSNAGSASAALPFLSGAWCGTSPDRDPVARATFGVFKSPLIYRRENY